MVPSILLISLFLFWWGGICHDVIVQVPWRGELGLEFQFFAIIKLYAHAILEERDDLVVRMLFIPHDIVKK